jgi:hypothetical protein
VLVDDVESDTVTVTTVVITLDEVPAMTVVTTVSVMTAAPVVANNEAVVMPVLDVPLTVSAVVEIEAEALLVSTIGVI